MAIFSGCFGLIKWQGKARKAVLINTLLITSCFCLAEALLTAVTTGLPWFSFHAGLPLAANLYFIQPAAYFGVYILSFVVLTVNYLTASFIRKKAWSELWIPAMVVSIYFFSGYITLQHFNQNLQPDKKIRIAILTENIPPETKWNDQTGDALAARLIHLSREAAGMDPDIALWSESAIPWTFQKDDDLIAAIVKTSAPEAVTHLLGMNTQTANQNEVYNAAYCITADGKASARYDKQILLTLIEKPFMGFVMPFRSSAGFTAKSGKSDGPLVTPFGKAGILICNESTVPSIASNAVRKGAGFLCNMSNDGWFRDSYLKGLHFYNARLRAVETRKDLVVNSNMGYSGLIQASGKIDLETQQNIAQKQNNDQPTVQLVNVTMNHQVPLAARVPGLLLYFFLAIILIFFLPGSFHRGKCRGN